MTFRKAAEQAALAWKETSSALPDEARLAGHYGLTTKGPYDLCLPPALAAYNLLPEARRVALDRFTRAGIGWHHGTHDRCGNHLLSSQVQCANALAPFVADGEALRTIFGDVLDIAEVLPFGDPDTDPLDLVAFEWIGLVDHLGELPAGGTRTRGAHTTSADAALRYRTSSGAIEVALIEWKYVERYDGSPPAGGAEKMAVRHGRYRTRWEHGDGPLRSAQVEYEELFVEPVYQLFRLQLLADAMEQARELDADRVRLVYAAPGSNAELRSWLRRSPFDAVGPTAARTVESVWRSLLRRPDRFVSFDTAALVRDGAPTSDEFKGRYAHLDPEGT